MLIHIRDASIDRPFAVHIDGQTITIPRGTLHV